MRAGTATLVIHDKDLYARILNIEAPWRVAEVELNEQGEEVVVRVEHDGGPLACPQCGQPALRYAASSVAPSGYLRVPNNPGRADAAGAV